MNSLEVVEVGSVTVDVSTQVTVSTGKVVDMTAMAEEKVEAATAMTTVLVMDGIVNTCRYFLE